MVREMKFFDLYKSFDENEKITGVCLGEAYTDDEKIYFSSGELYNAPIEGTTLNKILQEVDIKFNAI